jgi:hypothetical protein
LKNTKIQGQTLAWPWSTVDPPLMHVMIYKFWRLNPKI